PPASYVAPVTVPSGGYVPPQPPLSYVAPAPGGNVPVQSNISPAPMTPAGAYIPPPPVPSGYVAPVPAGSSAGAGAATTQKSGTAGPAANAPVTATNDKGILQSGAERSVSVAVYFLASLCVLFNV
ncbi:hypothetical protein HDU99_007744, partial [Rhizoclosmatium hyalinum]